jgi:phosphopantothenoylcysteine decarboxylase/phosphopantothenate--cysteine ligase
MSLKGRKILLGISSSIAAYKSALLIRLLIKQEAEVQVLMTPASHSFIGPLTLSTLSKRPVLTEFVSGNEGLWNNHVELGLWADAMIIAPASANTLACMSNGICNNLLLATYLSARCKVFVAPAMDLDMYTHFSTVKNLATLQENGVQVMDATEGELASGLVGKGRMAEPEQIVLELERYFAFEQKPLLGKKVLVTAGPTYEYIDPVRFLGNASSGKMGYAVAEQLLAMGAELTLVSGPVKLNHNIPPSSIIKIVSAQELFDASSKAFEDADIAICAAAVADYTPVIKEDQKIKKADDHLNIELTKTPDTLQHLGNVKNKKQIVVGFALETNNELEYARQKLEKKKCDMLVMNTLNDSGAGFNTDTNKVTLVLPGNKIQAFPLKHKNLVAADICNAIVELIKAKK